MPPVQRIPPVKSLCEIVPEGAEGGKEFARLLHLLLHHQARRSNTELTLIDDLAGDWSGLDSFEEGGVLATDKVGYQYKRFPSPFSDEHRSKIKDSLERAIAQHKESKITKWILVTCDGLVNSGRKAGGGDVTWFNNLKTSLKAPFNVEHWGHDRLLALFLETPSLCLRYYPELMPNGLTQRKTIQEITKPYIDNLLAKFGRIEFVGMSVFKDSATRGVAMDDIYIPLTTVPENANEDLTDIPRTNPQEFLAPGRRTVILGDPGSGKSTLLRFLALAGKSQPLQQKFNVAPDKRLPLLVILRHYADALKENQQLSLLDYLVNHVRADYALPAADLTFFEYYLEAGEAILLFDGMDELPNSHFKEIIRDRITALSISYPGNTVIVTSRIVGYDGKIRFRDSFFHQRVAPLQLPEIEMFVKDWYHARLEDETACREHVSHLLGVITHEDNEAIRTLAANPLLLTIIVLVHRIDAVLPDKRLVLYKKCVETLLISWDGGKFRSLDAGSSSLNRNKEERYNKRRIEAIAYWMHLQAGKEGKSQRSVVKQKDLLTFLSQHISKSERHTDAGIDPEDRAVEFLGFIKKRAGLLVEVGDGYYSFVHLTFQEYLAAIHLITKAEHGGDHILWQSIQNHLDDPRWHEVIRLLVAGRESDESQESLVGHILEKGISTINLALLAGGLLLDGIQAAEDRAVDILTGLLIMAVETNDEGYYNRFILQLRRYNEKNNSNDHAWKVSFAKAWDKCQNYNVKLYLLLTAINAGKVKIDANDYWNQIGDKDPFLVEIVNFLLIKNDQNQEWSYLIVNKNRLLLKTILLMSNDRSVFSNQTITLRGILSSMPNGFTFRSEFIILLNTFLKNETNAWFIIWLFEIIQSKQLSNNIKIKNELVSNSVSYYCAFEDIYVEIPRDGVDFYYKTNKGSAHRKSINSIREFLHLGDKTIIRRINNKLSNIKINYKKSQSALIDKIISGKIGMNNLLENEIIKLLLKIFQLPQSPVWHKLVREQCLPQARERLTIFDQQNWQNTLLAARSSTLEDADVYHAAWQLLIDVCTRTVSIEYTGAYESPFTEIADLTRNHPAPALRIAHCIRDLDYGDESRIKDLEAMVKSNDPGYRDLFVDAAWRDE